MASTDEYAVGWVCVLPIEVAAARATLDRVHENPYLNRNPDSNTSYMFGSLQGHHVIVAYPTSGVYGQTSVANVARQLHAAYPSVRLNLTVGIAGGVPETKEDVRLGDVIVGKPTAGWPGVVQFDVDGEPAQDEFPRGATPDQPTPSLVTAMRKAETAANFDESQVPRYVAEIVRKDPVTFARPSPEQDLLFDPDYDHATVQSEESGCGHCDRERIRPRPPREVQGPMVHYGLVASSPRLARKGAIRDKSAQKHGSILCFETQAAGLRDVAQYLVIRGICDYADSHRSGLWHAYAAAAAAAYAKEVLSFIPTVSSKTMPLATSLYAAAAPVLDALLLTRPEVDRKSLVALKGHRVDGTCEWLIQHAHYREWLAKGAHSLLWISGGPGKGKTMLAIYVTEMLQPVVAAANDVLLYYFCSNRDKNRNSALTIMRGILHQWIDLHPHLAKDIKSSFEGAETTKYTISSFASLWRVFLTLLQQSTCSQVFCVLDGLDECEAQSLGQLLDAVDSYFSKSEAKARRPRLQLMILSRPRPAVLETKLGRYPQIQLDTSDTQIAQDVEKYIFAKVAELASEQAFSDDMVAQLRQTLLAGADQTFLWVGFVAHELQGRSWRTIDQVLRHVPKGLGGIYQRLLQQVDDKEALVLILQWVVLAARPLTLEELTVATGIKAASNSAATQATRNRLSLGGLLVKVEGEVANLVHESAREFFQSEQVNVKGTNMFYMGKHTHRALMQTCLTHIENGYENLERVHQVSDRHDPFLTYASQYWPVHFHHAVQVIDAPSEFARPFFQVHSPIRDEWWKTYWEQEKNGGSPPSFTLLHFAAYFGNVPWATLLLREHARLLARKDNYGRTPLFWAVDQGHRAMVELLLRRGALVNLRDRSMLTALHIAVTGQHRDVVAVLLTHGARLEAKAEHGDTDTPLLRAILANSRDITQELLEHGARVDKLPALLGVASLRAPTDPVAERVKELLGLQEQVLRARFQRSSRFVDLVMKGLGLSLRVPLVLALMSVYLKHVALNRWDSLSVLQALVQENKTDELREWAKLYHVFFLGLVVARNPKRLEAMGDLSTHILQKAAPRDLEALLAITVFTGMETQLAAVRHGWRQGDAITAAAVSNWAAIACDRDAVDFFHFGIREFLRDFDGCIRDGNREENVLRAAVLLTSYVAMIGKREPGPLEYFSRVVAKFFEGYIGSSHEVDLYSDASQACANELYVISQTRDSARLRLLLTGIFQLAQQAHDKGQDRFLNIPSAACLILCQKNAIAHRWMIGEAMPEAMGALIAKEPPGPLQKRACKTFVECLLLGRQYGLALPRCAPRQTIEHHLQSLPEVIQMMNRILG